MLTIDLGETHDKDSAEERKKEESRGLLLSLLRSTQRSQWFTLPHRILRSMATHVVSQFFSPVSWVLVPLDRCIELLWLWAALRR